MEEYIELIDRQSRLFRQGQGGAAKDLDAVIYWMKARRETAINALLRHEADHWKRRHGTGQDGPQLDSSRALRKTAAS